MLLLAVLGAIITTIDAVCYVEKTETVQRSVITQFPTNNLAACKVQGLVITNSESVVFNPTTKNCVILDKPAPGGLGCEPGYVRQVKMKTGCAKYDLPFGYDADPCFANAKMNPELLTPESSSICPNTPLDGEPKARTYVVSVILTGGKYAVFDNNSGAQIVWDVTNATWYYRYQNGRDVYVNQEIYAASCAYYPDGVPNDCACNTPLPKEASTSMEQGATAAVPSLNGACEPSYSGKFIQAKSNMMINCGPCRDAAVVCINKMWIYNMTDPARGVPGQINSFQVTSGTCYLPPPTP